MGILPVNSIKTATATVVSNSEKFKSIDLNVASTSLSSSSGIRSAKRSQMIIIGLIFLIQLSIVNCVPEDYYNPDYDELNNVDNYLTKGVGNWGDFLDETALASGTTGQALHENLDPGKRHVGALAAKASARQLMGLRNHRNDIGFNNPNEMNFGRFRGFDSFRTGPDSEPPLEVSNDSMKKKRFLGSMARGGWFPRSFRGYNSDTTQGQPWDKRHLGTMAKLGWLHPYKPNQMKNSKKFDQFQAGRIASLEM